MEIKTKIKIICVLLAILIFFNLFLYKLDTAISPTIANVAKAQIRKKTVETINRAILDEYNNNFNYDEVIKIEKDSYGNIIMLKADTLKMNKIACEIAIKAQAQLNKSGNMEVKIPLSYVFKNNILAGFGPSVVIKAEPIGSINTEYLSEFENAGINQTRHKIYINVDTQVNVILPLSTDRIDVKSQIPVAETIIIGKVPSTVLDFDLKNAGFKLPEKK